MTWEEWEQEKARRRTDDLVDRSLSEMHPEACERHLAQETGYVVSWEINKAQEALWAAWEDSCFYDAGCMAAWGAHMCYSVALDRGDPAAIHWQESHAPGE